MINEVIEPQLQEIVSETSIQRNTRILEKLEIILQIVRKRKNEKVNKSI
jgi:hypothetical protein